MWVFLEGALDFAYIAFTLKLPYKRCSQCRNLRTLLATSNWPIGFSVLQIFFKKYTIWKPSKTVGFSMCFDNRFLEGYQKLISIPHTPAPPQYSDRSKFIFSPRRVIVLGGAGGSRVFGVCWNIFKTRLQTRYCTKHQNHSFSFVFLMIFWKHKIIGQFEVARRDCKLHFFCEK